MIVHEYNIIRYYTTQGNSSVRVYVSTTNESEGMLHSQEFPALFRTELEYKHENIMVPVVKI